MEFLGTDGSAQCVKNNPFFSTFEKKKFRFKLSELATCGCFKFLDIYNEKMIFVAYKILKIFSFPAYAEKVDFDTHYCEL